MCTKSESIKELALALSKAQAVMGGAIKDSTNPFFKSNYADLESVWSACRKPLTDNGLAVIQMPSITDGKVSIETMLTHSSGEWISSTVSATPMKNDPQSIGSVMSYLRRYALASVVGVYQTDDDAEHAHDRKHDTQTSPTEHSKEEKSEFITEKQRKLMFAKSKEWGISSEAIKAFLVMNYGIETTAKIPANKFNEILERIPNEINEVAHV